MSIMTQPLTNVKQHSEGKNSTIHAITNQAGPEWIAID
jgi:hypothetical protein